MGKALIVSIILILLFPVLVFAISPGTIPGPEDYGIDSSGLPSDTQDLLDVLGSVVKWVYTIFFIVAVLFIIFAAFNYLTGAGTPDKIKAAHSQLIYAAIAIAVALLAISFQLIVGNFLEEDYSGAVGTPSGDLQQYWVSSNYTGGGSVV
ncbi:MAG: hypothetical protein ABIH10_02265 [Spirochaetota bacterium]